MWTYNYSQPSNELYHYGVLGMKWGHRKARPVATGARATYKSQKAKAKAEWEAAAKKYGTSNTKAANAAYERAADKYNADVKSAKKAYKNSDEYKARVAKAKKVAKVGAAVAGTALAVYGAYKLSKYVQNKRNAAAMQKASDYVNQNLFKKRGFSEFADGARETYFTNGRGDSITIGSRGSKTIGQHNAKTIATARQMYKDATNTKLDRGLSKVVNTGDSVGRTATRAATSARNTATRAATSARNTATKAKNRVLDVVKPMYEYTPGESTTRTYTMKGFENIPITETVTNYYKTKKRRG